MCNLEMRRLSVEERHCIITLVANGYSLSVVRRRLLEEGTLISLEILYNLCSDN